MSNGIRLTKEQEAAVVFPSNKSAVVTAAAGSGKTALLVERIIRLISDEKNPINAGSLAIMTFTVNATKSLREKLNNALQERISNLSGSDSAEAQSKKMFLSEQIINLRNASISTINAFCLNIIRENFQKFDLPVMFSIADETKKTSMQWSAVQLAMRDFYDETCDGGFNSDERDALFFSFNFENDTALFDTVISTAEKLFSYGNVEKWLDEAADAYSSLEAAEKKYINVYTDYLGKQLEKLRFYANKFENCIINYENDLEYEENEAKKKKKNDALETLVNSSDFDGKRLDALEKSFSDFRENPSMEKLENLLNLTKKTPENPEKISRNDPQNEYKKSFNANRKAFQEAYAKILDINFLISEEEITLPEQRTAAQTFSKLVKRYIGYYSEIKRTQGCIDFSDCELLLLDRLQTDEDFRNQLSQRFSCIIVDEFQDSNDVQAEIFRLLGRDNLFYVGDVKQSIYAFRGANPMIMARLCKGKDGFTALPLNKNFRSRKQVVDVVNAAFCGLMTEEYGGVDYSDGNMLEYGANFPDDSEKFDAEIYALDLEKCDDDNDMRSARFVAGIIKKYVEDEDFFITKGEAKVKPNYSDFIILTRKNGKIKNYRDALSELNISSIAPKGKNFLVSEEILLMINLLKVVDNPLRDEELLNVMMSPIYRFSAEEIAELKLGVLGFPDNSLTDDEVKKISSYTKRYSLYGCLGFCTKPLEQKLSDLTTGASAAAETEKSLYERGIVRSISAKASDFLNDIESFRYFMSNNSTDSLLRKLYEATDIFAIVSAYDDSRQRISNLRRLEKIAADFVTAECGTLADFLRFLEKSTQNSRDIEEASAPEDAANSVKIMTFHASKGLEAPICILAELENAVNPSDYSGKFLINQDFGFSIDYVDRKNRFSEKTFCGQALKILNRKKPIGEELRLLYVAMTRAREKLIMVGRFTEKSISELCTNELIPEVVFDGNVPFRWVLSSLCKQLDGEISLDNCTVKTSSKIPLRLYITPQVPSAPTAFENSEEDFSVSDEETCELAEIIEKPYSNFAETQRQAKFSVTELAHKTSLIPFTLTKPAFALSDGKSGADVGNAYHCCMENISFDEVRKSAPEALSDCVSAELFRLCDEGKITEDELDCISADKIAGFFTSSLGKRVLKSSRIEREFPFYDEIDGSKIDSNMSGIVGIQGRVDLCFEENGELVVVDYKTDYDINSEKDAYARQVAIYAEILPRLLGKRVSRTYLYSFSNGDVIEL